jgi:hypothetical protein
MPRNTVAGLTAALQIAQRQLHLYQEALWRPRQFDVDAVAEVPERDAAGKPTGCWYRYALFHVEGNAGGILIETFSCPSQLDAITPYFYEQWRRHVTTTHEQAALRKIEVALYRRKQKAIQKGTAQPNA